MEWSNALKRTRNGSIYSETTSALSKLRRDANKRQKIASEPTGPRSTPCHLELLPAELLQQIFLTSMNGNLLTTTPRIAVKLSGSKVFYRAAFILAFYSHDVEKMFDIYNLHYLVPILDLPLSSWDVRSMTKAVLDSRWCTYGQVEQWLSDNLHYAVTQLLAVAKPSNAKPKIEKFLRGETHVASLTTAAWWAQDEEKRSWQLETDMWDILLLRDSDIRDDEKAEDEEDEEAYERDAFTAEWRHELVLQFQMRFLGVLTFGDEKSFYGTLHRTEPFRRVIQSLMGFDSEAENPKTPATDFWQLLDDRAILATRNAHWLRETLAIEFYFYPEDQPFKVSPRLYRAAALADINLERVVSAKRGSYVPVLYALFEVDPLSLPKKDPALCVWAKRARRRILQFFDSLQSLREEVEEMTEVRRRPLKNRDRNKFRSFKLEHIHKYEQDWKIVTYLTSGVLDEAEPKRLAPKFTEHLQWMGERLNSSSRILDEAEKIEHNRASQRDVDIFEPSSNGQYELGLRYQTDQEIQSSIYATFDPDQLSFDPQVLCLDKVATAEARYALTTPDSYYKSMDHDGYDDLFYAYEDEDEDEYEWGAEDVEDWDHGELEDDGDGLDDAMTEYHTGLEDEIYDDAETEDEMDDEEMDEEMAGDGEMENEPASVPGNIDNELNMSPDGLLEETPIVMHRNLGGLDLSILFPDDLGSLPPNDTELVDPIYGPPKWFHVADRPYFQELRSGRVDIQI